MDRTDLALLISIVSASFTGGGLIWQFALYRLSGARIDVRLIPAVLDSSGTLATGPEKGWPANLPYPELDNLTPWTVDLALVRVTNIGRTPVSVDSISLDFGRFRWFRRGRYTVQGNPIAVHGSTADSVVRLEAGASVSVIFDLWQLVKAARKRLGQRVVVRASTTPAGRRNRRSSWRNRWKFSSDRAQLRPTDSNTHELRAYRALWRAKQGAADRVADVSIAWSTIQPLLNSDATVDTLADELASALGPGQKYAAYIVLEAYHGRDTM